MFKFVSSPILQITAQHRQYEENQIVSPKISLEYPPESMYKAAREGNWAAAESLLNQYPNLAYKDLPDMGDRALHVAASMLQTEFLQKVIASMNKKSELCSHNGHGYTLCCYEAMTGKAEVDRVTMKENSELCTTRNKCKKTSLQLAASYGDAKLVLHFLRYARVDSLRDQEWFDLLLVIIRSKLYDVALQVLDKVPNIAIMTNEEGTALHVLAQMDISLASYKFHTLTFQISVFATASRANTRGDDLAKELWTAIKKLEMSRVLELIEKPPLLHDAAKAGNLKLITMITNTYPDLLECANEDKCSIFHIAVMCRHESMLDFIKRERNTKYFNEISEDRNGNNILHLAGKLVPLDGLKIVSEPDIQMQRELAWFKAVEAIVPPYFQERRNRNGYKPRELFWMEHKQLLQSSASHMKSTAESCTLIATIILTVVFAAAFTPPGGSNEDTGIPILLKSNWFTCFIIFEVLALFTSTYCIIGFWSIISSNYEEDQFLILPIQLRNALCPLLFSIFYAVSAFMSAFFMLFIKERTALVKSCMLSAYLWLVVGIGIQFYKLYRKTNLVEHYYEMGASPNAYHFYSDSLLRRIIKFLGSIPSSICNCFRKQ